MHILGIILAAVAGASFWIWQMRQAKGTLDEIGDAAMRAKGAYNRAKFRRKAENSPFDTVDDPREAAAVLMISIAKCDGDLTEAQRNGIARELKEVLAVENPTDMLQYARWVADQAINPDTAVLKLVRLLNERLEDAEKHQLVAMLRRVAAIEGSESDMQRATVDKLGTKLGLTPTPHWN